MPTLHYLIGDATEPTKRPALIIHVCNNINKWGKGFVLALSTKFPEAERQYHEWFRVGNPKLGQVQFVQVTPEICIGNMIAQEGIGWKDNIPPIRYDALNECLKIAYDKAAKENFIIAMPRIGAVLSGGDWGRIEKIILANMAVDSYVYTLEKQKNQWPTDYDSL